MLCLLPWLVGFPGFAAQAAASRPNFIVINVDDLGYADIAPFGSVVHRTPHLDRMAAEGRRLTSHYAAVVCSPSRAALMTGCYPKRVLPISQVLFPAAEVGLNPDEHTVAEYLNEAGYATACVGKWHLGDQPEFLPTRQGFDEYFGIPYSNDMGTAAEGSKSNPGQPISIPKPSAKAQPSPDDRTGLRGSSQPPLPLLENETVIERVDAAGQATLTRRYTERAERFIRQNQERPFFLYLPHTAVHFPHYPAVEYRGRSKDGLLGDWVEEVDASVGRILDTVRTLDLGARTLVLFTSDNGGPVDQGANNGPLRGGKAQTFEGGIRVCTIAWWPGTIPAGSSTDEITTMMDILPTFVKLAGASVPDDPTRPIDGRDIGPLLTGMPGARTPHDAFYYHRGLKLEAVRAGRWKLHLKSGALFNLDADIGESHDVQAAHGDVAARLRALAERTRDDLGTDGIGPGCRPLGRVAYPQPLIAGDGRIRPGFQPR
jgi:arylsulfatase A